jgi:hypothetical protein
MTMHPAPPVARQTATPWSPVGRSEDRQWTQADLEYWNCRDPGVVTAAMNAGRLAGLGIGPRKPHYGRPR